MSNITFIVFTYNEEKRIRRVIENFRNYGRILIADNRSKDRTCDIAREYGCDIFIREKDYEYVENQELVDLLYERVTTDWIYWGLADEMLEKETLDRFLGIVGSGQFDIVEMDRKNYFYGRFCYNLLHAWSYKLFRKKAIDFRGNAIHGMGRPVVPANRILRLDDRFFVHHFISNTANSYLNVINRYTETELKFAYKAKAGFMHPPFVLGKSIIKEYFYNKGYKAGFAGFALLQLMVFYNLIKNIKHYEKDHELTTPKIEDQNDHFRDKILSQLDVQKLVR